MENGEERGERREGRGERRVWGLENGECSVERLDAPEIAAGCRARVEWWGFGFVFERILP